MISDNNALDLLSRNTWEEKLPAFWRWEDNSLCIDLKFQSFKENTLFIQKVFELAELHNHHPELFTSYTNTQIRLTTHDAGGVTEKDIHLANAINTIKH